MAYEWIRSPERVIALCDALRARLAVRYKLFLPHERELIAAEDDRSGFARTHILGPSLVQQFGWIATDLHPGELDDAWLRLHRRGTPAREEEVRCVSPPGVAPLAPGEPATLPRHRRRPP